MRERRFFSTTTPTEDFAELVHLAKTGNCDIELRIDGIGQTVMYISPSDSEEMLKARWKAVWDAYIAENERQNTEREAREKQIASKAERRVASGYLQPKDGELFDTEYVVDGTGEMMFFVRPLAQAPLLESNATKTENDVSIYQSGLLDYPREFDTRSFDVTVPDATPEELKQLMDGVLVFSMHGIAQFHLPLSARGDKAANAFGARIKPGESFGVMLRWTPPLLLSRKLRVRVGIKGVDWRAKGL